MIVLDYNNLFKQIFYTLLMDEPIKVAIVGYGNIGRGVHQAIEKNNDMKLVGIASRDIQRVLYEFSYPRVLRDW